MAESKKIYTNQAYFAQFENDAANTPAGFEGLGYYRRTSLEDVINNFIVAYIGEDKALAKVPRYEVDFWAQRGLQEFSYDILHSEKSVEIELNDALTFPLPQDYVNITSLSTVDANGKKHTLLPQRKSNNPRAILQASDFTFLYDVNGELQQAAESTTTDRFQTNRDIAGAAQNNYDEPYDEDYLNSAKRYGSNPEDMNTSGTYFIDYDDGIIYFDGSFSSKDSNLIVLDYISDGLAENGDLSKVFIPKLAEDALYAYILYNLSKVRPASTQLVPLYKKEASAKMRNTKIRLTNYSSKNLAQVLRGKAKWIKH
jgi:hypothetical protein